MVTTCPDDDASSGHVRGVVLDRRGGHVHRGGRRRQRGAAGAIRRPGRLPVRPGVAPIGTHARHRMDRRYRIGVVRR